MQRAPYGEQAQRIPRAFPLVDHARIQRHGHGVGFIDTRVPKFAIDQNRDRDDRCLAVRAQLNQSNGTGACVFLARCLVLARNNLRPIFLSQGNLSECNLRQ